MSKGSEILNLKEMNQFFDSIFLTDKEGSQIKKQVLSDSLRGIVKEAKSNLVSEVNEKTGNLRRSLGIISKVRDNTAYAAAGASTRGKKKGYHFHIINSGTQIRSTTSGANRGQVQGTGFFDQAVMSNMDSIPATMKASFEKRMKRFMQNKY